MHSLLVFLMDTLVTIVSGIFDNFIDPSKRVFGIYLFSAGILALLAARFLPQFCQINFCSVYRGRAFKIDLATDLALFFFNPFFVAMLASYLFFQEALTLEVVFWLVEYVDDDALERLFAAGQSPQFLASLSFTLLLFLVNDLSKYIVHRMLHENKYLWQVHKLHHSVTVMTPLTVFRTHPLEALLFIVRNGLVQALVIGVCYGFWGNSLTIVSYMGCNVFVLVFNVLGANLRHSHVHLSYGRWLEGIVISPYQHQLHHSTAAEDRNCNYGVVVAIWDRLGGTLVRGRPVTKLTFGLADAEGGLQSIRWLYMQPFKMLYQKRS